MIEPFPASDGGYRGPTERDALPCLAASLDGAPGGDSSLGLVLAHLVSRHLRFDSADPHWQDRDRLVFEPALAGLGQTLCQRLCPETWDGRVGDESGLLTAAGPACGIGAGFALADRMLAARFGRSLVDHRSWVVCTGAELATGPVQEAAWLAGAWRLGRLTVIATVVAGDAPGLPGFAANGWMVRCTDAHDSAGIAAALSSASRSQKPTLIACIADGSPTPPAWRDETAAAQGWREAGQRLAGVRRAWLKRLARHGSRHDFEQAMQNRPHGRWHVVLPEIGAGRMSSVEAVRQAFLTIAPSVPELAVLPGDPVWPPPPGQTEPAPALADASGRLASGMSGALCGLALHGGLIPANCQAATCLEALLPGLCTASALRRRLVQVIVEAEPDQVQTGQRAGLRALENVLVFRPADASEAVECCEIALRRADGPSVLLVTQASGFTTADHDGRGRCANGGYVAAEAVGARAVTLIASGPELGLAFRAQALLASSGISAAVVSLPCWELFEMADTAWRESVLGRALRVGMEPGSGFGWERWLAGGPFIRTTGLGEDQLHVIVTTVCRHPHASASV